MGRRGVKVDVCISIVKRVDEFKLGGERDENVPAYPYNFNGPAHTACVCYSHIHTPVVMGDERIDTQQSRFHTQNYHMMRIT